MGRSDGGGAKRAGGGLRLSRVAALDGSSRMSELRDTPHSDRASLVSGSTRTGAAADRRCGGTGSAVERWSVVGFLVVVLSGCGIVSGTYSAVTGTVWDAVSKVFRSGDSAETPEKQGSMQDGLVKDEGPKPQYTDAPTAPKTSATVAGAGGAKPAGMSAAPAETMAVRLESLEADVDSLRTEFEALRPGIGRLISIEADIRDLLVQLALMKRQQTPTDTATTTGNGARTAAQGGARTQQRKATVSSAAKPPAEQISVHPASYRKMDNARRGWEKLSAAHRDVLDGLEYRISVIDLGSGRGTYYRLKAGPFDDIKAARQVCKAMKARKTFCVITDFSGDL